MATIAIIGGGIGGLAAAYRLREQARTSGRAVSIAVFEAGPRWGGICQTTSESGYLLEHGPDSIVRTKPAALKLISDLGLDGEVHGTEPDSRHALVARGKRLIPVPEGLYLLAPGRLWPFLWSPLLSWTGKLRMALDLLKPRRPADAPEESLAGFVRRRLGQEALERIAQPLVGGIYTADPEHLSVAATMPQFLAMEQEHRSLILAMRQRAKDTEVANATGPRYGLFASLRGGIGRLIEALVASLRDCDLHLDQPVSALSREGAGWNIEIAGRRQTFDQVVLALPAHAAARLCGGVKGAGVDAELAAQLAGIRYAGVATVNLAFAASQIRKLPAAAGFVVPAVEHTTVIACSFSSRKYAGRAPADGVLLRAFAGGALHEDTLDLDDDELSAAVLADLRRWLTIAGEPSFVRVHRWPRAMAQYTLGHRERLARIRAREAALPGLALIGNGYEGVGIPDIVAQAGTAAVRLAGEWR